MSIKIIKEKFIVNECFAKEFLDNEKICILNLYDYFKKYKELTENLVKKEFKEFDDIIFGLFPDIDRNSWSIDYSYLPENNTCNQFKFIKITLIHNLITEYFENILYKGDYVQVLNEEPKYFRFETKKEEIAKNFAKILENISNQEIIEKKKRDEIEKLKDEVEKSKHDFFKEKNDFSIMKNEILDEIKNDFIEVFTELAVKKIKTPKLEKFINKYKNL
jgi:hypothetical protein